MISQDTYNLIVNNTSYTNRVTEAFNILTEATLEKRIYNVDYESIKTTLTRAFEGVYSNLISKVHYWGGLWENLNPEEYEMSDELRVSSVPSVLSSAKKVNAYKGEETQFVKNLRIVINAFAEVATELNNLKPFIIKGRKPSGKAPSPENPNKIVKTCPCCFRAIAIGTDGMMVHHGYRRPGIGFQTNSCMGINFLSLEVSNEGLVALIYAITKQLKNSRNRLANLGPDTDLLDAWKKPIEKGTPEHRRALSGHQYGLESEIRMTTKYLTELNTKLENWKPAE